MQTETKPNYEVKKLKGTPFTTFTQDGEITLLLGNYKVTQKTFETEHELNNYLHTEIYDIILTMICIAFQHETDKNTLKPIQNDTEHTMERNAVKPD